MAIEVIPISWTVRYNGDGKSFDAGCVVSHCLDKTVEVHLGMALCPQTFVSFRKEMREYFYELGYEKARWSHKGEIIEETLRG